jgi:hypothetical protein
MAQNPFGRLI